MLIRQKGFTIVELLIVIVVIAILAAISIVAYNGIQTRAENNKTLSAVSAYTRAISAYAVQESTYPITAQNYPCLGKVANCANMTDTGAGCEGSGRAGGSGPLNTALSVIATSLPEPSTQAMNCNGKQYTGAYYAYGTDGKSASIRFYLKGDVPCTAPSGVTISLRHQNADTTACNAAYPVLP